MFPELCDNVPLRYTPDSHRTFRYRNHSVSLVQQCEQRRKTLPVSQEIKNKIKKGTEREQEKQLISSAAARLAAAAPNSPSLLPGTFRLEEFCQITTIKKSHDDTCTTETCHGANEDVPQTVCDFLNGERSREEVDLISPHFISTPPRPPPPT